MPHRHAAAGRRCTCSILPPAMLRALRARQREAALGTLATDATMRITRATSALLAVPGTTLPAAIDGPRRTIHDAANGTALPGKVVRTEGGKATRDAETDEAYDGLGATYDYYAKVHQRHSIDDAGLALDATVHYGRQYDNAFWNGTQMVFGDGDGDLFNRFTISLDVIAHELTHGVTEDEARLVYVGQSGALNESISDVFGSLVKQYARKQTAAKADWLIGEGLFTAKVDGVALRSMKAPGTAFDDPLLGKDDQPATMDGYVRTSSDNGGVHTNSGIPNHAFYRAAIGFGGHAWEQAGVIWYAALRDKALKPTATFAAFAERTAQQADRLFGAPARAIVVDAWHAVGVAVAGGAATPKARRR